MDTNWPRCPKCPHSPPRNPWGPRHPWCFDPIPGKPKHLWIHQRGTTEQSMGDSAFMETTPI
jgi:hypothetical protein